MGRCTVTRGAAPPTAENSWIGSHLRGLRTSGLNEIIYRVAKKTYSVSGWCYLLLFIIYISTPPFLEARSCRGLVWQRWEWVVHVVARMWEWGSPSERRSVKSTALISTGFSRVPRCLPRAPASLLPHPDPTYVHVSPQLHWSLWHPNCEYDDKHNTCWTNEQIQLTAFSTPLKWKMIQTCCRIRYHKGHHHTSKEIKWPSWGVGLPDPQKSVVPRDETPQYPSKTCCYSLEGRYMLGTWGTTFLDTVKDAP